MTGPRPSDLLRVAAAGLRTRRLRAGLSGLGVAIGIASMVAVVGVSDSSKSRLIARLDALGSNLLTVRPGQSLGGADAELPESAARMIRRVDGVQSAAAVRKVDSTVRRSRLIAPEETNGLAVQIADTRLLKVLDGHVAAGRFLSRADGRSPTVVLGSVAAQRLGVRGPGRLVWIGARSYTVVGVLGSMELAPEIDRSALIGEGPAARAVDRRTSPTTVYLRADPDRVAAVSAVAARTTNPERPEEVEVSNPSDALQARIAAKGAFTSLLVGLGAVALLVGGVGVANVMVIGVLERRREIGLRRALGARRRDITTQFLGESLLLSSAGGAAGVLLGAAVTVVYAVGQGWQPTLSPAVLVGGVLCATCVGALAGLYPALRASRLSPTEALRAA